MPLEMVRCEGNREQNFNKMRWCWWHMNEEQQVVDNMVRMREKEVRRYEQLKEREMRSKEIKWRDER